MSEAGLTRDEREALVEVIADQMRNLSVRIGPKEFAVPLMRGVDLAVEVDAAVTAIVAAREQAAYERGAADVRAVIESKASQARRQDDDTLIGYHLPIEWWRSVRPESHRNRPRGDEQTSGDQLRRCPTCGTVLAASACVRCQRYVTTDGEADRRACIAVCPDGSTDDPCWASCTTNDEGASGAREGGTA